MNTIPNAERAKVLIEALPYIRNYNGKILVVKYGGNAMINETLKQQVMEDIVLLRLIGVKVVLVHGGGPAWQWQDYIHLLAIWAIGIAVCIIVDLILKYIVRMPRSFKKGVGYIIRRNLWFQCINTPLVSLGICLYRHFVINEYITGNQLSVPVMVVFWTGLTPRFWRCRRCIAI